MGKPDDPEHYVAMPAGDLLIYLSQEIWDSVKSVPSELLVAIAGFGRFWVYLEAAE